jgi:hypothetical protein
VELLPQETAAALEPSVLSGYVVVIHQPTDGLAKIGVPGGALHSVLADLDDGAPVLGAGHEPRTADVVLDDEGDFMGEWRGSTFVA